VSDSHEFFEGFLDDYFAEADEHLTGARKAMLALEASMGQSAGEGAAIDELFRFFHSLKGISAMVELRPAEQLAHHLENYLRALRQRETMVSSEGIDTLLEGIQRLEQIISAHQLKRSPPSIDHIVARVDRLVPGKGQAAHVDQRGTARGTVQTPAALRPKWQCTFLPTRELLARGVGVDAIRKRLGELGSIVAAAPQVSADGAISFRFVVESDAPSEAFESLRADGAIVETMPGDANEPDVAVEDSTSSAAAPDMTLPRGDQTAVASAHVVRVDLARLDELMRSVGDLVICRARLAESLARIERHVPGSEWRSVQENAVAIDRHLRVLREGIMRVRLVPVGEVFRRMPFVVRDLARETRKKVNLELQGQSTEIDKYLIERIMEPVLHLVRNAVSHGIETADERVEAGKRPEGTIQLSASTAGEIVTIEVADDGRGVDAGGVVARARAMGLAVSDAPDAAAILAVLCAPGFSTKDDADRASGRGVGMAVVKSTIEELSGSLTMESEPGTGTRFLIRLPLTLAITDALIGRVGADHFAVPQSAVREVVTVEAADIRMLEQNEIVPYRGGSLPIARLGRLFGIDQPPQSRFHVFVVGAGLSAIGLAVDRIVGQREIVVRAIADPLVRVDGISGATDLGDGRVVLILDPAALSRLIRERTTAPLAATWGHLRAQRG
jgi:two-component system, chemotaxis family, sensor kinase CheA